MSDNPDPDKPPQQFTGATLGIQLAVGMVVFAYIGYWFDQRSGNQGHYWTLAGIFVGLFYCGYEIWKIIRQNNKEEN